MKFLIYSSGYNCQNYVVKHMLSIYNQRVTTPKIWEYVMVDDCSTDNTYSLIKNLRTYDTLIRSDYKRGWACNAVEYLKPDDEDIVVIVDMDDQLASGSVIKYLKRIYKTTGCWMTYGSFIWESSGVVEGKAYPEGVDYRSFEWRAVHLQTFKGFLWNNINKDDFKLADGSWATSAYDRALMLPILEMTPYDKQRFIPSVLYIYNNLNPLNVGTIRTQEQINNADYFHSLPIYKELKR